MPPHESCAQRYASSAECSHLNRSQGKCECRPFPPKPKHCWANKAATMSACAHTASGNTTQLPRSLLSSSRAYSFFASWRTSSTLPLAKLRTLDTCRNHICGMSRTTVHGLKLSWQSWILLWKNSFVYRGMGRHECFLRASAHLLENSIQLALQLTLKSVKSVVQIGTPSSLPR
jgi:hypothetical protein